MVLRSSLSRLLVKMFNTSPSTVTEEVLSESLWFTFMPFLLVLAFQNYLPGSYTEQACDGSVTRETIPGFLILKKQLSCLGSDKRKPMPGPLQFPISLVTGDHSLRITLPRQEAVNGLEITNQTRRPSRLRKAHSMCVWVRPR